MRYLRTNTATRITVGPFFDQTDGITPEVAITVTSEKLTLVVDTGGVPTLILDVAPTASGGANDMVHITGDDAGFYDLELAAADVNYLGRAMLALTNAAAHCPIFHEFMIVPANIYDSMFGTDLLDVSVTQWLGTAVATPTVAGVPEVDIVLVDGAATTTALLTVDDIFNEPLAGHTTAGTTGKALIDAAVGVGTGSGLTAIPWNAAWDAEVQSECQDALVANGLDHVVAASVTGTDIVDNSIIARLASKSATADWDTYNNTTDSHEALADAALTAAGVRTAIGMASANLDTQLTTIDDFLDTEIGAIKTKTDFLPSATAGAAGGLFIAGTNAATTITTGLTTTFTGSLTGNVNGSVASVTGNVGGNVVGQVGSLGTQAKADVNIEADTALADAGVSTTVTARIDATISSRLATAGYTTPPTVAAIADGVLLEQVTDHSGTPGSVAAALAAAGAAGDPWTAVLSGYGAGTAGKLIADNLNATVSSRSTHSAADVWAISVRLLTAGTNIVLAKGVGVTGFNDISAAQVNAEVDTAISDVGLTTTITSRIDASMSSRLAAVSYVIPPSAVTISAQIWQDQLTTHSGVAGSTAAALAAAQSAGDPWSTLWSDQYGIGTMGYRVGTFVDEAISSRLAASDITLNSGAVTVADKNGFRLSATGVDDIHDEVIEGAYTFRQLHRGYNSALFGKASGLETTNPKFRDLADSKDRINATADASGNRSAIVLDLAP